MSHLLVLGLDNREDAGRVFDLTCDLVHQQLLQLQDTAYAWRDDKGKIRIQQAINLLNARAASGALWGTLIGLIFLNPLAGLAVGAATRGRREADRRRHKRRHDQVDRPAAPAGQGLPHMTC
jgi:uncharacterized membrane protein